jgi:hypothetical protein
VFSARLDAIEITIGTGWRRKRINANLEQAIMQPELKTYHPSARERTQSWLCDLFAGDTRSESGSGDPDILQCFRCRKTPLRTIP